MSDQANAPLPRGWVWDSDGDAVHPDGSGVAYYRPEVECLYLRLDVPSAAGAIDLAESMLALARARRRPDLTSEIHLGTGASTPLREVESEEEYAERHGWRQDSDGDWCPPPDQPGGRPRDWWDSDSGAVWCTVAGTRRWFEASTLRAAVDEWRRIRAEEADRGEPEPDRGEVDADRGEPAAHLTFAGGVAVHVRPDREVRFVLAHVVSVESAPDDSSTTVALASGEVWHLDAPSPQVAREWSAQIAKQSARARGGGR